ncbi:MAG TPA: hypothetical protein VK524_29785, partial [Polyangiaceae bacterium]|nr:hypothetical protein [Polyangiaceae bacterium]
PGSTPVFINPASDLAARHWDRLAVSRWDSAHYIGLALRGYSQCPEGSLLGKRLQPILYNCDLSFYPGYAALGWLFSFGAALPIDYVLWGLSLFAGFCFLFLWTGPALVKNLGLRTTWISFLIFNCFPTAFSLVTIQTESCTLAFALGSFAALHRRHWILGALLAGGASGMRVTGAAAGAAFALAVLVLSYRERPRGAWQITSRLLALPLAVWGLLAMMGYHYVRFGDPLLYVHSHSEAYGHGPSILSLLFPKPEWLLRSIDHPLHEGVILLLVSLWFILGHRRALSGFAFHEQVFWYTLTASGMGVALLGSVELAFAGMNRYALLAFPIFFSIAAVLRTKPLALAVWLLASSWHYWQVDMCDFVGNVGDHRLPYCNVPQWQTRHW